jgi:hypothetical protein
LGAVIASPAVFLFFHVETVIAYPFAAEGTLVKVHTSVQICPFKGGLMFPVPYQFLNLVMGYGGKAAACIRFWLAFPTLAAVVAKEAERKFFAV